MKTLTITRANQVGKFARFLEEHPGFSPELAGDDALVYGFRREPSLGRRDGTADRYAGRGASRNAAANSTANHGRKEAVMRRQESLTGPMVLGPFPTSMPLSREANVEDEGSPKVSVETRDLSGTRHKDIAEGIVARYRGNHQKAKQMAEHYRVGFPQGPGDHNFWERVSGHIDEMKKQGGMAAGCRGANCSRAGSASMTCSLSTAETAVTCGEGEALQAHSSQPEMANLGPMISGVPTTRRSCAWWGGLVLLAILRSRSSRHDRMRWQGPTLPPGCVMVVRYSSR